MRWVRNKVIQSNMKIYIISDNLSNSSDLLIAHRLHIH
jgi:hypothetical protein